ncbi:MAG: hypothetical protein HY254_12105 [Burkholderiales bacterium]|nr:hypothetical protein [Burkholderiales bacterium]
MTIYWNKGSIPALNGLSKQEQSKLILPLWGVVWRRWQVWSPVLTQVVLIISCMVLFPQFPYRLPIFIAVAYLTVKLSFLPFHHYLALELEKDSSVKQ